MRLVLAISSPLTWPSNQKSDCTEKFVMTGSVDGRSVLPETQFVGTRVHVDTTQVLPVGVFFPMGVVREGPEFDIKPPLGD